MGTVHEASFAMRPIPPLLATFVVAVAVVAAPAAHAQHNHAAHAQVTSPVAPPAQPWPADATLSANMARIHDTLELLRHHEMGHMDATLARDQADVITESASEIFAKCELTPERDAVLHGMLVPLLAATQKFKADPADVHQLRVMRDAVASYPRYFTAPGWTAETGHAH